MDSLLGQLGIDGKLLIAQGINFLIVLVVLRAFIYRPLLAMMKLRREKIERGLIFAEEAERKLAEGETIKLTKIEEGEKKAAIIVEEAGDIGRKHAKTIIQDADLESKSIIEEAERIGEKRIQDELLKFERGAKGILIEAISSAVAMNPGDIDEKLITDALGVIKNKTSPSA